MPPASKDVDAANAVSDTGEPSTPAQGENTSRVETLTDDVSGVDFKILRTLRDLMLRRRRVTDAALARLPGAVRPANHGLRLAQFFRL